VSLVAGSSAAGDGGPWSQRSRTHKPGGASLAACCLCCPQPHSQSSTSRTLHTSLSCGRPNPLGSPAEHKVCASHRSVRVTGDLLRPPGSVSIFCYRDRSIDEAVMRALCVVARTVEAAPMYPISRSFCPSGWQVTRVGKTHFNVAAGVLPHQNQARASVIDLSFWRRPLRRSCVTLAACILLDPASRPFKSSEGRTSTKYHHKPSIA
jgi:hypothetical protein